jgi:hypothetical protein
MLEDYSQKICILISAGGGGREGWQGKYGDTMQLHKFRSNL